MKKLHSVALTLLLSSTMAPSAFAQSTAAAKAARLQRLQQQQAAVLARAKAAQAAATATPTPTTAPTPAPKPAPALTVAPPKPTAVPTVTAAPTTAASVPKPSPTAVSSATPATSAAPVASAVHPDTTVIALNLDALRKSRPERRHAEFVDMQSRWGSVLSDPRATDELKLHAQRLAYLQRIRALGAKDTTFVKGVDALITKEETRDSDALNALRSGALPTAAPVVAAPVVAVPAAAPIAAAPTTGAVK